MRTGSSLGQLRTGRVAPLLLLLLQGPYSFSATLDLMNALGDLDLQLYIDSPSGPTAASFTTTNQEHAELSFDVQLWFRR